MPGGPKSSTPLGMRAPSCWNFLGFSRNSLISSSSSTVSSMPATSLKVTLGASTLTCLARLLPKLITLEPPPCMRRIMKIMKPMMSTTGNNVVSRPVHDELPLLAETATSGCLASSWASSVASG